ncbi:phage tail tip lysozyme [Enterococcus faecium]|uniref:phage tail tip lysozyme n=1 Tax=Enterococcus faecium TaxID=1352 RepID=UPI003F79A9DC
MKKSKRKIATLLMLMVQFTGIAMSVITINPQVIHADGIATYDAQFNCTTEGSGSGTDSDGNDTGSGAVSGDVAKNIDDIYKFMNGEYGLSGATIAGILGNWKQESGNDPRTVEGYYGDGQREVEFIKQFTDGLMGIGYGQWTAGRHTALVNWAKKNFGGAWWTTEAQLDFMFKGDGGFVGILKDYALNASDDVVENAVTFHKNWEISADSESAVIAVRGENAKEIWKYMKSKGMDGAKDESKINKISGGSSTGDGSNNSSSSASGTVEDACATTDDANSGSGSIGKEGKINGKKGQVIANMTYEEALKKYGKAITLPKFKEPDWSTSPFNGIYQGQCTELTWAYMSQLYDGNQPTTGNGGYVWESYKSAGAKITNKPIVGYGFSASDGWLWAVGDAGHTGVVIAVFEDGSFLCANFNVPPTQAPTRGVSVTLIDGVDGSDNVHFFSGVGKAKFEIEK